MKHSQRYRQAMLELTLAHMPMKLILTLLTALILSVVLVPNHGWAKPLSWFLIIFIINGLRLVFNPKIQAYSRQTKNPEVLERYLLLSVFVSGVHWALGLVWFLDSSYQQEYLLIIALTLGLISSAIPVTSSPYSIWFAYTGVIVATAIIKLLSIGESTMALTFGVYLVALWYLARVLSDRIQSSITREFQVEDLLKEVTLAKDQAERAIRQRSQFMAATSHDLRQPLHAQGLLLESLKSRLRKPENIRLLSQIEQSNIALNSLFEALLEISQLDAGSIKVQADHYSLRELCEQLQAEFEPQAMQKGLTIKFDVGDSTVHTDPVLLTRVLRNLLSNAIKYTPSGDVILHSRQKGEKQVITVSDTGIGIPNEQHEAIFDEYTQLDNSARDRVKGIGLGLAIVKRMCDLLKLPISVKSSPNNGASFSILAPIGDSAMVVKSDMSDALDLASNSASKTIFVIDNDPAILLAFSSLMLDWGHTCQTFASLEEVLEFKSQSTPDAQATPDLLIVDYRLGGTQNGTEVIQHLHDVYLSEVPAVIVSGDTDPKLLKKIKKAGYYMLHKPLSPVRIETIINAL